MGLYQSVRRRGGLVSAAPAGGESTCTWAALANQPRCLKVCAALHNSGPRPNTESAVMSFGLFLH
uniref:Uncharacterized protein n=1 Tax=Anguilla anguilla TaxID=7936 RepID=A0A0E9UH90_ANGAN